VIRIIVPIAPLLEYLLGASALPVFAGIAVLRNGYASAVSSLLWCCRETRLSQSSEALGNSDETNDGEAGWGAS
jgi:hypothetical protein